MSELIDSEKVAAVFGPTNSGNAMAWKHIANQKKIPVIGNVGSGTDITKPMSPGADNYMFRVSACDDLVDRSLMNYCLTRLKKKAPGIILENTPWGESNEVGLRKHAQARGVGLAGV